MTNILWAMAGIGSLLLSVYFQIRPNEYERSAVRFNLFLLWCFAVVGLLLGFWMRP